LSPDIPDALLLNPNWFGRPWSSGGCPLALLVWWCLRWPLVDAYGTPYQPLPLTSSSSSPNMFVQPRCRALAAPCVCQNALAPIIGLRGLSSARQALVLDQTVCKFRPDANLAASQKRYRPVFAIASSTLGAV